MNWIERKDGAGDPFKEGLNTLEAYNEVKVLYYEKMYH